MGVLNTFFAWGVGNSPIKKIARGGGWSGLELTDTLVANGNPWHLMKTSCYEIFHTANV